ncbi:MAG: GAF domain-containing protein, partial [Opitutaceae bacterium]
MSLAKDTVGPAVSGYADPQNNLGRPLARATKRNPGRLARVLDALGWSERARAWNRISPIHSTLADVVVLFEIVRNETGDPIDFHAIKVNDVFARLAACPPGRAHVVLDDMLHQEGTALYLENVTQLFREGRTGIMDVDAAKLGRHFRVSPFLPGGENLFAAIAADITHQKDRDDELLRLSRYYSVLSQINQVIVRASTGEELLRQVCRTFVDKGSYGFAWAGLETRKGKPPECIAHWGAVEASMQSSGAVVPDVALAETSLRENRIVVFNDLIGDPGTHGWGEAAMQLGFHSAAAFPLRERGSAIGSIALYSFEQNAFSAREVSLLKAAVEDISC